MKRTLSILALIWTMLVMSISGPAYAQSTGKLPIVRIGTVADGPQGRVVGGTAGVRAQIQQEILGLTRGEFDVRFPKKKQLTADWSIRKVQRAIERLLADPEVDIVIALGVLSSQQLAQRPHFPKPAIASVIVDREIQGLPYKDGASGVKNLNYITFPGDIRRDLKRFRELVSFKTLGLFYQSIMIEAIPELQVRAARAAGAVGADIRFIPVELSAEEALAALPNEVDAIYLPPLPRLPEKEFKRLIQGIIKRGLPSFALLGRVDVEQGALAGVAPAVELNRLHRRLALNVQRILLGEDASTLSVTLPLRERLVINMATARAIGFSPTFRTLRRADLLFEAVPSGRQLSLESAVREAVDANLDIKVAEQTVAAGKQDVREARSALFPQLDLRGDATRIDPDLATVLLGQSERETRGSLALDQIIYSEPTLANVSVQRSLQQSREAERDSVRLDIIQNAATAYLDVLRTKTNERIARDNVELTRENLELAKLRRQIGTAGPAEVFRWESELATSRGILVSAGAQTRVAKIALNQVLNRPLSEAFTTTEVGLGDPVLITSRRRLVDLISNRLAFARFTNFMVEEGFTASSELRQIEAAINAQERTLKSTKRAFWQPQLNLTADQTEILSRSGEGADVADALVPDSQTRVALQLSLPLYTGGGRSADKDRAFEELTGLRLQRQSTRERVEQRIRSSLQTAGASYENIALSRQAADAAIKNFELVQESYARGVVSIIDLLDAQNSAVIAEQRAANAIHNFLIDLMEVERAVSRFDFFISPEEQEKWMKRLEEYFEQQSVFPR
ncbi:MAG: TolC family protein [Acidiferrobacterales bacterium]